MKSKHRVLKCYKEGTKEWGFQYNMLLDDGVTCDDCGHAKRCFALGYSASGSTTCDFYPNRFRPKRKEKASDPRQDLLF